MPRDIEAKRAYDREYSKRWQARNPGFAAAAVARHPDRHRARQKLNYEVRMGRVIRLDCEVCGSSERVQAHHAFGYGLEMATAVWWLCTPHHWAMHVAINDVGGNVLASGTVTAS